RLLRLGSDLARDRADGARPADPVSGRAGGSRAPGVISREASVHEDGWSNRVLPALTPSPDHRKYPKGTPMQPQDPTLATFYASWKKYQEEIKMAIAPLTAEQLALRAAPNLRSIGENVCHIIGTRVGWFHNFLGEGGDEIVPFDTWDADGAPARSAAE